MKPKRIHAVTDQQWGTGGAVFISLCGRWKHQVDCRPPCDYARVTCGACVRIIDAAPRRKEKKA